MTEDVGERSGRRCRKCGLGLLAAFALDARRRANLPATRPLCCPADGGEHDLVVGADEAASDRESVPL